MVYKFRIISDEADDFLREIKINSEATFYDLHEAILKCTGYKDDQMTSFFICDDDWEKGNGNHTGRHGTKLFRRRHLRHEGYQTERTARRRKSRKCSMCSTRCRNVCSSSSSLK